MDGLAGKIPTRFSTRSATLVIMKPAGAARTAVSVCKMTTVAPFGGTATSLRMTARSARPCSRALALWARSCPKKNELNGGAIALQMLRHCGKKLCVIAIRGSGGDFQHMWAFGEAKRECDGGSQVKAAIKIMKPDV